MNQVDYEINKELGECYLFMGEYDKAHDYYMKAVSSNGTTREPFMGLAAIAVHKGELDKAHTFYRKAKDLEPGAKPLVGMGMIEVEQGRYAEAFDHFRSALEFEPGNMMAVNNLLQLAYVLRRLDEALPCLEAALGAEASDGEAVRYALAACLLTLGRDAEARQHLEILLGEFPSNESAKQLYAQFAA